MDDMDMDEKGEDFSWRDKNVFPKNDDHDVKDWGSGKKE